jgi:hypothetical protein
MASIFWFKDPFWISLKTRKKNMVPIRKTGNVFSNYTRRFYIVGGRKHQEKTFLHNYVSPLIKKINAKKQGPPLM